MPATIEDMKNIYSVHQVAMLMEKEPELLTICVYMSLLELHPNFTHFQVNELEL